MVHNLLGCQILHIYRLSLPIAVEGDCLGVPSRLDSLDNFNLWVAGLDVWQQFIYEAPDGQERTDHAMQGKLDSDGSPHSYRRAC